ncbi:MAG: SDR family oxidoreductase [Pirellulaceae bacterium]
MSADFLNRLFSLSGQTAVVIGGAGVVGGAIAEGLARAGAYVIVAGRNVQRGYQRVDVLRALASQGGFLPVDVTSRDSIRALLEAALDECGNIDMLVNCAGVPAGPTYEKLEDEDWRRVIDVHLTAAHLACQVFAPRMAKQEAGGAILNIGGAASTGSSALAHSATTAAVIDLTRRLAAEYAARSVRINVLCADNAVSAEGRDSSNQSTALDPNDLVGAALLLLSRNAGHGITGAALHVSANS